MFYGAGNVIGGGNFFTGGGGGTPWGLEAGIALHAVVGCVTSAASGGKCGPGALSAAFSKAMTPYTSKLDPEEGVFVSAVVGGTASVLGGGKFANGAVTAAFSYIFNYASHVHRAFTEQGANGVLPAREGRMLAQLVVDADIGTQGPEDANRHGMCSPGQTSGECALAVQKFINSEYSKGTVVGLANAIHALQDITALGHRLQTYYGMGWLVASPSAIPHLIGDFVPSPHEELWVPVMTQNMIRNWTAANPSGFRQYVRDLTH
jgi:hypothetical protein